MKNTIVNRIGEIKTNNFGSKMEVIEYSSSSDILVRFLESGNIIRTQWVCFSRGTVKNPYDRNIYGIGYLGEGRYKATENGEKTNQYLSWRTMMQRCYSDTYHKKHPTYKDCSVVEEWHNFQTFAKWYDENYYEVNDERICLDKDILVKGNKLYSPETCIFVPSRINMLFIKNNAKRGELPIGVVFSGTINNPYESYCANIEGKRKYLGTFTSIVDAFNAYKECREKVIREVANNYKDNIPVKLYEAMIKYEIEIDD